MSETNKVSKNVNSLYGEREEDTSCSYKKSYCINKNFKMRNVNVRLQMPKPGISNQFEEISSLFLSKYGVYIRLSQA